MAAYTYMCATTTFLACALRCGAAPSSRTGEPTCCIRLPRCFLPPTTTLLPATFHAAPVRTFLPRRLFCRISSTTPLLCCDVFGRARHRSASTASDFALCMATPLLTHLPYTCTCTENGRRMGRKATACCPCCLRARSTALLLPSYHPTTFCLPIQHAGGEENEDGK